MKLEKGMNRYKQEQIVEDMSNQAKALSIFEQVLGAEGVNVEDIYSPWDYEFYIDNQLVAIGEYRRRFVDFGTYKDFQFSKHKFDKMLRKSNQDSIDAFMIVEFNDKFTFFKIEGTPKTATMKRKHENRTEECVIIPNELFSLVV
jgi:hypothetical protein